LSGTSRGLPFRMIFMGCLLVCYYDRHILPQSSIQL
jgi:hypothetical protein